MNYADDCYDDEEIDELEEPGDAVCRGCGCTSSQACEGGCVWAFPDLCSACVRAGRG